MFGWGSAVAVVLIAFVVARIPWRPNTPWSAPGTRATRRGAALMSTGAILMMLFAMLVLWEGWAWAIYT